ncbi:hypothetical protein EV1_012934 [Malus domestica]
MEFSPAPPGQRDPTGVKFLNPLPRQRTDPQIGPALLHNLLTILLLRPKRHEPEQLASQLPTRLRDNNNRAVVRSEDWTMLRKSASTMYRKNNCSHSHM